MLGGSIIFFLLLLMWGIGSNPPGDLDSFLMNSEAGLDGEGGGGVGVGAAALLLAYRHE